MPLANANSAQFCVGPFGRLLRIQRPANYRITHGTCRHATPRARAPPPPREIRWATPPPSSARLAVSLLGMVLDAVLAVALCRAPRAQQLADQAIKKSGDIA